MLLKRLTTATALLVLVNCGAAMAGGLNLFKLDKAQEAEIAQEMHAEYEQEPGFIQRGKQYDQLQRIGKRLVQGNELKEYDYKFFLVKDDSVNAFATPGGYIYVHKGLVDLMGYDESMLASVIAHELGHAKDRHPAKGYEQQLKGGTALGLLGALFGGDDGQGQLLTTVLANAGGLMYLKYNRDQEEWADRSGVTLTFAAGYDAYGMVRGLQCLEALYGSSAKVQNIFEGHPPNAARANRTLAIAQETAGKAHGYLAVPLPPTQDHPLTKLYGKDGTARAQLGKPMTVIDDGAATFTREEPGKPKRSGGRKEIPVEVRGG